MDKEQEILHGIIEGHRQLLHERYDYDRIEANYSLPDSFSKEKLSPIRTYFLEYIYPEIIKRQELDEAFSSLDEHIKSPERLGRLVLDSASLIFKYGFHLPKIFSAGIKALKSFRSASNVEESLAEKAEELEVDPPYSKEDIVDLMTHLPSDDLHELVNTSIDLYEILFDHQLVAKIIEVIDFMIKKMEKRPNIYAPEEVKGLRLGRSIIAEGDELIQRLTPFEQQQFKNIVEQIEKDSIREVQRRKEWNEAQ